MMKKKQEIKPPGKLRVLQKYTDSGTGKRYVFCTCGIKSERGEICVYARKILTVDGREIPEMIQSRQEWKRVEDIFQSLQERRLLPKPE